MTAALAKYDPRIEGAAFALLDKMYVLLFTVDTVVGAKEIHTLAKVAQERALSYSRPGECSGRRLKRVRRPKTDRGSGGVCSVTVPSAQAS